MCLCGIYGYIALTVHVCNEYVYTRHSVIILQFSLPLHKYSPPMPLQPTITPDVKKSLDYFSKVK